MTAYGRKRTLRLSLNRCSLTAALEKKADVRLVIAQSLSLLLGWRIDDWLVLSRGLFFLSSSPARFCCGNGGLTPLRLLSFSQSIGQSVDPTHVEGACSAKLLRIKRKPLV